jgi:hypothetical protein
MAVSYPLSLPNLKVASIAFTPRGKVSVSESEFTFQQQVARHQGQRWEATIELPPMPRASAAAWLAFFTALNGREGTFYLQDTAQTTTRGTLTGTLQVGYGAAIRGTYLPLQSDGGEYGNIGGILGWEDNPPNGSLAVGDFLQIGTYLYMVVVVNDASSVEVWPRLRAAHEQGTTITYTSAKGIFRLVEPVSWRIGKDKIIEPIFVQAVEAI